MTTTPAVTDDETKTEEIPAESEQIGEPAGANPEPVEDAPAVEEPESIPGPVITSGYLHVYEDEPSSKVTMTVESGRFAKRNEESGRVFVLMSYPIHGNHHITELLLSQLKNPVDATFASIQARLPEPKPTPHAVSSTAGANAESVVEVTMSVNGEDGQKVRTGRPRSNRATTPEGEALNAAREAAETPHAFERQDGDSRCKTCLLAEDDGIHALAYRHHAFSDVDSQDICGVCGGAYDDALHLVAMSPEAQALIDGIAAPA